MEYDEEEELTSYVWNYYTSLMTETERRVGWLSKAAGTNPKIAKSLFRGDDSVTVREVEEALADGGSEFCRRIARRLLAERAAEIFVNKCPHCSRVVRTPKARQCFRCGFDWHTSDWGARPTTE